jgi:hypothetical protein
MWKKNMQKSLVAAALVALTGCGSQAYVAQSSSNAQSAPGTFQVPAKVDIVLAQSDMGSMLNFYPQVAAQVPTFLNALQASGWDYHFLVMPLTTAVSTSTLQVAASQYDANWGSSWLPSYPGETIGRPGVGGNLAASLFSTPARFNGFEFVGASASNGSNGNEQGLITIASNLQTLSNTSGTTQIIRPDAQLIVIVVSTEEDSSGTSYSCKNQNGVSIPCPNPNSDLPTYQKEMLSVKNGNAAAIQFDAAVANEQNYSGACLGTNSSVGTRYQQMASMLGGESYDICSVQLSGVLAGLSSTLASSRLNMETNYLFIASAPNVATISVTKYPNGNKSNPEVIPEDPNNGWSYVGNVTAYAIDAPIPLDLTTGYAVKLNGSAKLEGSDTAIVNYTAAGLQNSS